MIIDPISLDFLMTTSTKANEIREPIGLDVSLRPEAREWYDVMNVQLTVKALLWYLASLASVLVSVPGLAALSAPIWASITARCGRMSLCLRRTCTRTILSILTPLANELGFAQLAFNLRRVVTRMILSSPPNHLTSHGTERYGSDLRPWPRELQSANGADEAEDPMGLTLEFAPAFRRACHRLPSGIHALWEELNAAIITRYDGFLCSAGLTTEVNRLGLARLNSKLFSTSSTGLIRCPLSLPRQCRAGLASLGVVAKNSDSAIITRFVGNFIYHTNNYISISLTPQQGIGGHANA